MKSYDVVIVTGWSNPGGSTESYINLTNALNDSGISTVMVGPQEYHTKKCEGLVLDGTKKVSSAKNVIWHYIPFNPTISKVLKCKNMILSCHEMGLNNNFSNLCTYINNFNYIHFVSEHQKHYHIKRGTVTDNPNIRIIQNIIDPNLKRVDSVAEGKVGGIIGSIDRNKQTHVAIQTALNDGCNVVRVFGPETDPEYFLAYVNPLLKDPRVKWHGVVEDKSRMYSMLTDVYHYSLSETWGYIKAECQFLGIPFHSNNDTPIDLTSTDDVINIWKEILV